jgi:hypothetical protein
MDLDDIIVNGFGMALGLGEEIAIEERAGEMSQTDDGVLGPAVSNTNLVPIVKIDRDRKLVDLTDINNWLVPMTKRLRSPFIEKWKRVALGYKEPSDPLLTCEEESAYYMAIDDIGDDGEAQKITENLKKLKRLSSKLRLKNMGKRIDKLRYSNDEA